MADEIRVTSKLTVSDMGVRLDTDNTVSVAARPIPKKNTFDEDKQIVSNVEYRYGFSDLELVQDQAAQSYGVVSFPITINNSQYVTISTSNDVNPIEYSIIDSTIEKPIIPVNISEIRYEKAFEKLPPRFTPVGKISFFEQEGIEFTKKKEFSTVQEYLNYKKDPNKIQAISYIPHSGKRLKLESNTVILKIIVRQYNKDIPVQLPTVYLNNHEEKLGWNR